MALAWADMGETRLRSQSSLAAQFREYPGLLRSRRFWGYCLTAALSSGAFFAFLGGAPYVGSEVYGLDPATLGLCFAAPAMGYASGNFLTGRYSMRVGTNRMIVWGTGITTLGMGLSLALTHAGLSGPWVFFGLMTTVGIGNGMSMPNATSGMLSARPHLAGTASGLGGAIMIGGGAGLSALAGALLVPGSGEAPLLWIMFLTSAASMLTIRWVIRRARALGLT
jgi:DHA1 family bicyclomycin/chloramphenicol resistance-like MFS transporter